MALSRDRRRFLTTVTASALLSLAPPLAGRSWAEAASALAFGPPRPFDFKSLVARAETRAKGAYQPPPKPAPEITQQIDYKVHGQIHYKPEDALYADGPGIYPVTFFHLGRYFQKAVGMYAVEDGKARRIRYSPGLFDVPTDSIARKMPKDAGFAGLHVHEARSRGDWKTQDWVAFLGASYFRAIGALGQYGMSARGIAIDTATPKPEEFPDFTAFYIAPAPSRTEPMVIDALLDGPSLAGAYRFQLWRETGVTMEVECRLFLRKDVERFGIAPLTSMFWFAEYGRWRLQDWRPEVHDSDGLAMWTGKGERLWRPLNNPPRTVTSSFMDHNPRGFGLLQRDRTFDHYLDGVHYERRPSVWVEPIGDWGEGVVQLVEIPTDDEIHDNIVAFWVPRRPARAGNTYAFRYKLYWLAGQPFPPKEIGRCVATRMGRGGQPGLPRPKGVKKFVVSFAGGPVAELAKEADVKVEVTASRGKLSRIFAQPIPGTDRWRARFDLAVDGDKPVELRAYLHLDGKPLTETWLYQYWPTTTEG